MNVVGELLIYLDGVGRLYTLRYGGPSKEMFPNIF